ncbi:hypothetical protein MTR67_048709 [Solanum verrucosum]|uniref:Uncharacterized protein n=1 Tax=Solanum verrucosum TaxID=315347 RepID=A0AAF1A0C4_SOLVR|nr:hypothetical protein MTR67_048709 [Solanum verrucosum]
MMGDKEIPKKQAANGSKNKKKKKRGGSKKRMTSEQTSAYNCVSEWVFLDRPHLPNTDDFSIPWNQPKEKLVFELHSHSIHSDGFLSPSKLVERAHQNGGKFFFYRLKEYTRSIEKAQSATAFLYQTKLLLRHLHFPEDICSFFQQMHLLFFSSQMVHSILMGTVFPSCLQPFIVILSIPAG